MNGNDLVEYEEKNCSRLQPEFLESKGISLDIYERNPDMFDNFLEGSEYWKFVEEDMHG